MFKLLTNRLTSRTQDEQGEVSLEYVLVGGLMATAIVASIGALSGSLAGWFTSISTAIGNAI